MFMKLIEWAVSLLARRVGAEAVMQTQLYEARRHAVDHFAAAEHHRALATMYQARTARLEKALGIKGGSKTDNVTKLRTKSA